MVYPNSTPEFRQLQKQDGTLELQVRYINESQGYTGKWMPINVVQENISNSKNLTNTKI
jgi:hypothetical protein